MTEQYRAKIDFEFGGVKVKAGDIVPCHRDPWSILLDLMLRESAVSLPVEEQQ